MKTLKEIKDEVAKQYQYDNWDDVRYFDYDRLFNNIARIVHRQACEAQRDKCNEMHDHALDTEYPYSISDTPLIELK